MPLMQLQAVAEAQRLQPVTATIPRGQILHLVGPNGAGKSTLLACIAGLQEESGSIVLNGTRLGEWPAATLARHRAYLPQHQPPPFAMPVWHYLKLHQQHKQQDSLLQDICATLGLADKLGRQAHQLSGGEWQRVRLAAVTLQIHPLGNPDGQLLLLDEPMNSLDIAQQVAFDGILAELNAAGITVVMSSHDLNHTLRFAHRVWLLRAGALLTCGESAKVLTAANLLAAYGMPFQILECEGRRFIVPRHHG